MIDPKTLPTGLLRAIHREAALKAPPNLQSLPSARSVVTSEGGSAPSDRQMPVLEVSAQTVKFTIPGAPMGKPRMTRRDKWAKRPCVLRYREWADRARAAAPADMPIRPVSVSWMAYLPIPASWSAKKRAAMSGQLHRQKPDRDNVDKGVLDALFREDCGIAHGILEKRWDDGRGPRVEVTIRFP